MLDTWENRQRLQAQFDCLRDESFQITSPADMSYNCMSHALQSPEVFIWPEEERLGGVYWPEELDTNERLETFEAYFVQIGFERMEEMNYLHEFGVEKVALYVAAERGRVTHVARQNPATGKWESKLAEFHDIEHMHPHDLEGDQCGEVAALFKRGLTWGKGNVLWTPLGSKSPRP